MGEGEKPGQRPQTQSRVTSMNIYFAETRQDLEKPGEGEGAHASSCALVLTETEEEEEEDTG